MKYKILKDGMVQGGNAKYNYDEENHILWDASIKVGLGFLAKTYSRKGILELEEPELMLSENMQEGLEKSFGPLQIKTIKRNEAGLMECSIRMEDGSVEGSVLVSTEDMYIKPTEGAIVAKVSGFTLNIKLVLEE